MRRNRGITIILLCLVFGMITLPMCGLFAFECVRAISAREQLRSACESAALAGAAALASSDQTNPVISHNDAIRAAQSAFRANSINGVVLASAAAAGSAVYNPPADRAGIFIEFLDPNSTPPNQPVSIGNTNGRIVRIVGMWGHTPTFGRFLGVSGPFTMRAEGFGRVPQLDIVLCFDDSGSIDDQTPVTLMKRWRDTRGTSSTTADDRQRYKIARANSGAVTTGDMCNGRIYDFWLPPATGTGFNAINPMNLDSENNGIQWRSDVRNNTAGYSAEPYSNTTQDHLGSYSHSVVNINVDVENPPSPPVPATYWTSNSGFPYTSPGGYTYQNIYVALEASLGNLESGSTFSAAFLGNTPEMAGVTPRTGYQADYNTEARKRLMPIKAAQDAALTFYNIMNTNTEAHFALTTFDTNASSNPTDTKTSGNHIGSGVAPNPNTYPRPGVTLSKTATGYANCIAAIPLTRAEGNTNITEAVNRARTWLQNSSLTRPGAKKTIVVFTDGQPTVGGSPYSEADACNPQGIAIYSVGLAQNTAIIPGECENLNSGAGQPITYVDQNGNPGSYTPSNRGISQRAGNGGRFYLVTDNKQLRYVFENIARQLVQLVKPN